MSEANELPPSTEGARGALRVPGATYRLQFHAGFTFKDACRIIPYLQKLGITDCYASPYLKARPGSKHGYDICDHQSINPEIGSDADCATFAKTLHDHGMGQILDIVPNHMGIVGNENAWWNDILENGPCARHAGYFDVDWDPLRPDVRDKVMLCLLGEPYGKVLESGQIALTYEAGAFVVRYFEHRFPVAPETSLLCLRHRVDELEQALGKESPELMEYQSVLTALAHLPHRNEVDPTRIEERYREKEVIRRRLAALTESSPMVREFVNRNVRTFNGAVEDRHSFDLLDRLLNEQAYRLAYWQVAADEINYRRFFDVNELAALSMEKPDVFADTHGLILRLIGSGAVTGLRVDHPDGLFDPRLYFETLQRHAFAAVQGKSDAGSVDGQVKTPGELFRPFYVLAEKILGRDEQIPEGWPIHGTTGYEFLNHVNGLFVARANERPMSRCYERWTGMSPNFGPYVYDKKFLILQVSLSGELHVLAQQLDRLSEKDRWSRDFTLNSLRHALRAIIACFPVYRSYITDSVSERDRRYVEMAVALAKRKNPLISGSIFDFVRRILLLQYPAYHKEADRAQQRRFVGKFQQVTAPVMAKGLEDTAFYVFNRLISLNEVGGDPGRFGYEPAEVHGLFQARQKEWPCAMSTTATHDTKRGEDVRARINVLSEMPREWQTALSRWSRLNKKHRTNVDGADAPDRNDEYLLYQTLIGAWPLQKHELIGFSHRIVNYMTKAVHEAKVHTSWTNPNPAYDDAVRQFVVRILDEAHSGLFLAHFRAFQKRVSHFGIFNALSQVLIKLTAPGVPDLYQGTELWDLSLVDPDNRRAVDYERREKILDELVYRANQSGEGGLSTLARELVEHKEDGRIKCYLIWRSLQCRLGSPELFVSGEYIPL
ncbi:MAG TPA: malto-oligosyltrehalose synthase, partial [Gemmataceae bacterium]|nr:malto-oligosyltrehalose synthase [Gemmataceae bacterium]